MLRYYITSGEPPFALDAIQRNLRRGIDMIQIREKELSARQLLIRVREVLGEPNPHGAKILVNERLDVALAAGAHGVHLPAKSIFPRLIRAIAPPGFLVGVSCHNLEELKLADTEGADFAVFGPVYPPLSKKSWLPAVGLEGLRAAVEAVRLPVLALGGITEENIPAAIATGAAGVAGITLFQD